MGSQGLVWGVGALPAGIGEAINSLFLPILREHRFPVLLGRRISVRI